MWKKIIAVGALGGALLAGTALAVASTGPSDTPATSSSASQTENHWTQMSEFLGEDWPEMVDHMTDVLGDRFEDMENLMKSDDFAMDWSDMEEFMDGIDMDWSDMGEYMDGSRMGDFDMGGTGMDWSDMGEYMDGSRMGDFDMGGSHMGGTDTGGLMNESGVSGSRSGMGA